MPLSIDQIPTPVPSATDPANFSARGDAVFGAFPNMITQTNALASEQASNRDSAEASKIAAALSETNAATYAANAVTSSNNANSSSVAPLWVSGTTYSINDKVTSPSTGQVYRRKTVGAGTTDPSSDSINWYAVLLDSDTQYPSIRPTLNLDFANSGKLDPRITFTRASTATYFDKLGILRTASNNEARFDYDPSTLEAKGLLIEESRQNLLLQSEAISTASWTKSNSSVSQDVAIAPTGLSTADKLVENTTNANHQLLQNINPVAGTTYTFSGHFKAGERLYALVVITGAGQSTTNALTVNLTTGAITIIQGSFVAWTSQSIGNGWYRVSATVTSVTTAFLQVDIRTSIDGTWANRAYLGDGVSGIYVWGLQFEAGNSASSYIPTTVTAVTRQADIATISGTNFTSWYNQSEGTFDCIATGASVSATGNAMGLFGVSDGTSSNRMWCVLSNASGTNSSYAEINISGVQQAILGTGLSYSSNQRNTAFSYKVNDIAFSRDSGTVLVDNSASIPTVNQLGIGNVYSSFPMNGWIKTLTYYPKRIQNYQLQILTK